MNEIQHNEIQYQFYMCSEKYGMAGELAMYYSPDVPLEVIFEDALLWLENSVSSGYLSVTRVDSGEKWMHIDSGKWEKEERK